jgi:hypothetical protein
VASRLRGKRIGTVFVREIGAWANENGVTLLTADSALLPPSFKEREGFRERGSLLVKETGTRSEG